jgi:hypothetical protein
LGNDRILPLVSRDHEHIHNHGGAKLLETWEFTSPAMPACSAATSCKATIQPMSMA